MAGYLKKVNVDKLPTQALNVKINSEILEEFQKKLKQQNLMMCTVIEVFARQYTEGNYFLSESDILKWENDGGDVSTLNTPINKEIYLRFKDKVKSEKYFVRYVLSAFIEDYAKNDKVLVFATNE